jgi:hypothetical protein
MARENPVWGQERIANELLLKLGLRVSPRTVAKYMPRPAPGRPEGGQRWSTFLCNHARAMIACDFLVAVTSTFRVLPRPLRRRMRLGRRTMGHPRLGCRRIAQQITLLFGVEIDKDVVRRVAPTVRPG